jgi:xanthine phosphoribosyltransferase
MKKQYYSYNECLEDCAILLPQIRKYNPDCLVSIARGGLIIGHLISEALDLRNIFSLNSIHYEDNRKLDSFKISNIPDLLNYKTVLLIDDIVDSGETMVEILKILSIKYPNCQFKIATLFYKKDALIQPDFKVKEAKNWINFFWEVDLKSKK